MVLVVDDDPLSVELLVAILDSCGQRALVAANALEALEHLGAGDDCEAPVEIIISDMHMPLMDGIALFRELRDQGLHQPFVLLSGDDPVELKQREPALDACLLKDFSLEESLPRTLRELRAGSGATGG